MAEEFRRRGHAVDNKAVVAAALLHDIGRSKTRRSGTGSKAPAWSSERGLTRMSWKSSGGTSGPE